jgi:hypothetical protein
MNKIISDRTETNTAAHSAAKKTAATEIVSAEL